MKFRFTTYSMNIDSNKNQGNPAGKRIVEKELIQSMKIMLRNKNLIDKGVTYLEQLEL